MPLGGRSVVSITQLSILPNFNFVYSEGLFVMDQYFTVRNKEETRFMFPL